jgi:hexosaminidase
MPSRTPSPACNALFASSKDVRDASDLKQYFLRRVNALAQERGLGLRVWSEAVTTTTFDASGAVARVADPSEFAGNRVSVNAYAPLRYYDGALAPLAESGYQVVLGSADYLYLDHAQEADPREPGAYWATRFTDLRKLFGFISGNPAANAALTPECANGACAYFFAGATPVTRPENIIGLEAAQWSEAARTDEQLEAMLYPRAPRPRGARLAPRRVGARRRHGPGGRDRSSGARC